MRKAAEELNQSSHKLAEVIYAKASQQASQKTDADRDTGKSAGAETDKKKDDVVDADFTEVKD